MIPVYVSAVSLLALALISIFFYFRAVQSGDRDLIHVIVACVFVVFVVILAVASAQPAGSFIRGAWTVTFLVGSFAMISVIGRFSRQAR